LVSSPSPDDRDSSAGGAVGELIVSAASELTLGKKVSFGGQVGALKLADVESWRGRSESGDGREGCNE